MNKEKQYRQCVLGQGNRRTTGWIEDRGARAGLVVSMELIDDQPEFWTVLSAGDVVLPGSVLFERGRDYLRTRKASDI